MPNRDDELIELAARLERAEAQIHEFLTNTWHCTLADREASREVWGKLWGVAEAATAMVAWNHVGDAQQRKYLALADAVRRLEETVKT